MLPTRSALRRVRDGGFGDWRSESYTHKQIQMRDPRGVRTAAGVTCDDNDCGALRLGLGGRERVRDIRLDPWSGARATLA